MAFDTESGAAHPGHLDEATAALESLVAVLDSEDDFDVILQRLCQQVIVAVPEADMASVTLIREGLPETAAGTSQLVKDIDQAQYEAGAGPCLQAAATGRVVRMDVEDAAECWPDFTAKALSMGVTSYLSAPMDIDRDYSGALNLYGYRNHGFHQADAALLGLFTTAVEGALRGVRRYLHARALAEQLREALASHAEIEQAKGVLMAVHGINAEQAFAVLAKQSQRENIKVRDVAARFLDAVTQAEKNP